MTGGQVETFLRDTIVALKPPVSGGVYINGTRPSQNELGNAIVEDIVVANLTGNAYQLQQGSCVVNIYVPDILAASGFYYKDKSRTDYFEQYLITLPLILSRNGEMYFEPSSMIVTLQEEAIHQHFVSLKMDYYILQEPHY